MEEVVGEEMVKGEMEEVVMEEEEVVEEEMEWVVVGDEMGVEVV